MNNANNNIYKLTKAVSKYEEYKLKSYKWNIRMQYGLLHSAAYRDLNYAPALKVLNWFHEKIQFKVHKHKRGANRYEKVNDGEISFTYREANIRGLSNQKYSKAIKLLHGKGFIDIKKPGSGLEGDYTIYLISQRWEKYGTPQFYEVGFPYQFRNAKTFNKLSNRENSNGDYSQFTNGEFKKAEAHLSYENSPL